MQLSLLRSPTVGNRTKLQTPLNLTIILNCILFVCLFVCSVIPPRQLGLKGSNCQGLIGGHPVSKFSKDQSKTCPWGYIFPKISWLVSQLYA